MAINAIKGLINIVKNVKNIFVQLMIFFHMRKRNKQNLSQTFSPKNSCKIDFCNMLMLEMFFHTKI